MTDRHIVAMGGGEFSALDRYVLGLTDVSRPRVCFVPTASGDAPGYIAQFYDAFVARDCEPRVLRLFAREVADLESFLGDQDVIYVGGGNTANMLAVWRAHGLDVALRRAWEAGVALCGVSAGANCWFEASTTDSFRVGRADALLDGLGFLGGSFCPHYDSEPERRPGFQRLVRSGALSAGLACDDHAAVHFVGADLEAAVAATPEAGAYRVEVAGGEVTETPLDMVRIG